MNRFRKKFLEENPQEGGQDIQKSVDDAALTDPLRNFKEPTEEDEVLRASPEYKKRKSRQVRRRFLVLLFMLILVAGTYVAMKISPAFEEPSDQDGKLELGQALTATDLFQTFLRSNFAAQSPERLNTIKISGIIEKEGAEQEFVLYKKQPSMALLVLTYAGRGEITFGMDGEQVWQKIENQNGETQFARVTGETAEQIKATGIFFTPFVQYVLTYNGLDPVLEISDYRDETGLIEVSFTDPYDRRRSLAKIDGQTLQVLELEKIDENGEVLNIFYKDYERVNGFNIPRKIEHFSDGEITQSVLIDKAATNIGILSEVFKTPSELGSTTNSP